MDKNQETQQTSVGDNKAEKEHIFVANKKYFTISVYAIAVFAICILIYKVLGNLGITGQTISVTLDILAPFLVGMFIAFFLSPLYKFFRYNLLEKRLKVKKRSRSKFFAILLTYVLTITFITIIAIFVGPQIYDSIVELTQKVPGWYNNVQDSINNFLEQHPNLQIGGKSLTTLFNEIMPKIVDFATNFAENVIPAVFSTFTGFFKSAFNLFISFMFSIYLLADHKGLIHSAKRLVYAILPKKKAESTFSLAKECTNIFGNYLFGVAVDSLLVGMLCFSAMSLLQLPYPLLIGVIVSITNLIPYFGPFIGGGIGSIIILIIDPIQVIIFVLLIFALQQFDSLIMLPRILGESTGLRPLWVIFATTVGGSLFGVIGMFLGVPSVAVIRYLIQLVVNNRLKKKNIDIAEEYSEEDESATEIEATEADVPETEAQVKAAPAAKKNSNAKSRNKKRK